MKKLFFLLIFATTAMGVSAQKFNELINLGKYSSANAELAAKGVKPKVVFMGNSITEGWVRQHAEFFNDNNYVGRGISGQTTPQMLSRFREDVINLRPKVVVINGGTNDVAENTGPYNEDFTLDNIKSMAELAQANGIKVVLTSVLPAGWFNWRKEITNVAEKIDALNVRIKEYAKSKGFAYVDYNSSLRDEKGALKREFGADGVHPNMDAYRIMESLVQNAIWKVAGKK